MNGMGDVLAAHVPLGDDDEGIAQCSCGVIAIWRRDVLDDDVRYLDTHAEGPDLRWHLAHVEAALVAAGFGDTGQAARDALLGAADDLNAEPDSRSYSQGTDEAVRIVNWLRARAAAVPVTSEGES